MIYLPQRIAVDFCDPDIKYIYADSIEHKGVDEPVTIINWRSGNAIIFSDPFEEVLGYWMIAGKLSACAEPFWNIKTIVDFLYQTPGIAVADTLELKDVEAAIKKFESYGPDNS